MQVIDMLFLKIVEMGLTAGIVISVVLLVRLLLRRLPKSFAYMLWFVVAFRLVVPFSAKEQQSGRWQEGGGDHAHNGGLRHGCQHG